MAWRAGWGLLVIWMTMMGPALALTGPALAAEFDRGLKAYDAGQYQTAFQIWWSIRDQDLAATRNVALMLRKGEGVAKDPRKAEEVLGIAVHAHMPNAEVDLAEMYLNGEARPPEPKRAAPLLREASATGHPLGQYLLAQMYEAGNGVPKDMARATELYIAASRGGLHEAKERLASLGVATIPASVPAPAAAPVPASSQSTNPLSSPPAVPPRTPSDTPNPKVNSAKAGSAKADRYVQLGAYKSADEAEKVWAQQSSNALLHANAHQVVKADLGSKGVWYRLLVAAGPDRKSAGALCGRIKASGQDCLVR